MFTLIRDRNIEVDVTLWDTAAATFKAVLNSGEKAHTVMVVTSVAPEKIGGKLDRKTMEIKFMH